MISLCLCLDISTLGLNGNNCLSDGVAAGIAAATTFLLTMSVGVVLGWCLWYKMRKNRAPTVDGTREKIEQLQETIYDEPLEPAIPLTDNEAYGKVRDS